MYILHSYDIHVTFLVNKACYYDYSLESNWILCFEMVRWCMLLMLQTTVTLYWLVLDL